jgi:sulfatase maturation enzyme AslB (radical SAM superfamily)
MFRSLKHGNIAAILRRKWLALRYRADRWRARKGIGTGETKVALEGRFCQVPFQEVTLEESGACFTCCSSWLPTPMGNVRSVSLSEMWNGPVMRKIRESIYDGSFRYCRHDRCPKIQNGSLTTLREAEAHPRYGTAVTARATTLEHLPQVVIMVNDRSCNLYCPSCRTERINFREGSNFEEMANIQKRFLATWLESPNDEDFTLSITGSGDPFASRVYRELLYGLDGSLYPNMKIALQTNGVLLTPRNWERMKGIHGNISSILISLDAATPETYAVTRRGGHWKTLIENCRRLGELRTAGEIRLLRYDFVAQKANFREMPAFVKLARELGGDRAYFSRLVDWGTWPRAEFLKQCVWNDAHALRADFMEVLRDPALRDPFVDLGNLSSLHEEAMADRYSA